MTEPQRRTQTLCTAIQDGIERKWDAARRAAYTATAHAENEARIDKFLRQYPRGFEDFERQEFKELIYCIAAHNDYHVRRHARSLDLITARDDEP